MNPHRPPTTRRPAALRRTPPAVLLAALLATALPALAQYKVVGPDGKITYTDRAPTTTQGTAKPITGKSSGGPAASEVPLPLELRQAVTRYPVTLYTATGACDVCATARQLLRTRGVPYAEKQVLSPEDNEALQRLSGGQDVPTLTIGSQTLRGLSPDVWTSYLDAAGYPKDSRLPAAYQYPAPTSIVARANSAPAAAPAAASRSPAPIDAPEAAPENPTGIKF
ncbi:MAG TPA: glutaredoxin family protein [Burkholderiaceae bacterium]|jgi:glutaredoxin